jgi:AcrR family transcriptional regulator
MVWPAVTRAVRWSIRQAVTPLTTTVSAAAAVTPSGTATRSAASSTTRSALSLNAIAKELGISGPALYRYFDSRDSLLTELVIDAYHDLAAALEAQARGDVRALAHAYRDWALAEPHRYRLLFRAPPPGYDAHSERLVEASQLAMTVVLGVLRRPDVPPAGESPLEAQLNRWAERHELTVPASVARAATTLWARLHGLVSLEIEGNFASMGVDPAPLYDTEVADAVGSLPSGDSGESGESGGTPRPPAPRAR